MRCDAKRECLGQRSDLRDAGSLRLRDMRRRSEAGTEGSLQLPLHDLLGLHRRRLLGHDGRSGVPGCREKLRLDQLQEVQEVSLPPAEPKSRSLQKVRKALLRNVGLRTEPRPLVRTGCQVRAAGTPSGTGNAHVL
jgi:hypothetical protein